MPMYTFQNDAGETVDQIFKISERPDSITVDGVVYKYIISKVAIVGGVGGFKIPSNLKDRLTQIKKQNPGMKSSVV